jgi:tetratricopeptide (TPR) repeat protein
MSGLKRLVHEIHRRSLWQVLGIYVAGVWLILQVAEVLSSLFGLPDWFARFALLLCLIGLPLVLATAFVQGGIAARREHDPTLLPGGARARDVSGAGRLRSTLTWRNALRTGVAAFALLGVITTVYMAMRVLGIGPAGSLMGKGIIQARERIVLADFEDNTGEEIGPAVVQALRMDLSQSPVVRVAEPTSLANVLQRMGRKKDAELDLQLAREVALREGYPAVIWGEVNPAGNGYIISVQLLDAESSDLLAGYRETATSADAVIPAINRLSNKLRDRIGESLTTIRSNPPLAQVTTSSLSALKKYSQALRVHRVVGDFGRAAELYVEAVAIDTAFASAYSALAIALASSGQCRSVSVEAYRQSLRHQDRLTDRERYHVIGRYHTWVTRDAERAIDAFTTLLENYPDDALALMYLGLNYHGMRDFERAEEFYRRAIESDSTSAGQAYTNLVEVQVPLAKWEEAEGTLDRLAETIPTYRVRTVQNYRDYLLAAQHDYEAVQGFESEIAVIRGRLDEARRSLDGAADSAATQNRAWAYVSATLKRAFLDLQFGAQPGRVIEGVTEALERYPVDGSVIGTGFFSAVGGLVELYAMAGASDRAHDLLTEFEETLDPDLEPCNRNALTKARGLIALAVDRPLEAIRQFRLWDQATDCTICALPYLGRAYESAGEPDSAIAMYERYVETPWLFRRLSLDARHLARTYERLGELHEARGDRQEAIYYYGKLVDLWENADPELQPRVEAARRAMLALMPDR